jgi:aldehyde dehydrogenase (NAD+)
VSSQDPSNANHIWSFPSLSLRTFFLESIAADIGFSFINNEWVKGVDGKTFEVINPSDESVIVSVAEATEKDVDLAVAAARKAFEGPWRKETPENRGRLLVKLADLFEKNVDLLAAVESLDNGKAITMAKGDVAACAGCLRYYGGWADKVFDTKHRYNHYC